MTELPPILLHAPTLESLARARNSLMNAQEANPGVRVRIIANAQAVAAALDIPHAQADAHTSLCPNTLMHLQRAPHAPLQVLAVPAVLEIAALQAAGWVYIRA
ncbi:MAG: hypothetical protein RSC66_04410 [Comamonas sp.]